MATHSFDLFLDGNSDLNRLSVNEKYLRTHTREILKSLWQNSHDEDSSSSIFSWKYLSRLWRQRRFIGDFYHTIFVENDIFFLKAARLEVQTALNRLLSQLQRDAVSNTPQVDMAIHNILAIYAMFCPNPHEPITVPVFINNEWHAINYLVKPLELTPKKGRWLNIFSDKDRLYSYGLSATSHSEAPPLLLHAGTGWPTAQGSLAQYLSDAWPFETPGKRFFIWGKTALNKWLDEQKDHSVITLGQSLGGSMAYLTAMHRPDKIQKADCLNPPGMAKDYNAEHPLFGAWERAEQKPFVRIQRQQKDWISKIGKFKSSFYCVKSTISPSNNQSLLERLGGPHAKNYACFDGVRMSEENLIEQEICSRQRKKNDFYLYKLLRTGLFIFVMLPYTLLLRPIKKFIERHAFEIIIFITAMLLLTSIPPFSSILGLIFIPWLGSTLITAVLPSLVISQLFSKSFFLLHDIVKEQARGVNVFIQHFKEKNIWEKLYDVCNIVSIGLVGITYRALKRLILNPIRHLFEVRENEASVFSQESHQKTQNFNNYQGASFASRCQVIALIVFFYAIVTPLKCIFYDIPKSLFDCIKPTGATPDRRETDREERSSRPQHSGKRNPKHFRSLFCCTPKRREEPDRKVIAEETLKPT
jgi:hypothetical protein